MSPMSDVVKKWNDELVGKQIAFSTFGTIDAKYHGVVEKVGRISESGFRIYARRDSGFVYVEGFYDTENVFRYSVKIEEEKNEPICEPPVIDGCVPLVEIIRQRILA